MKKPCVRSIAVSPIALLAALQAHSAPRVSIEVISQKTQTYTAPASCAQSDTCSLREFQVVTKNEKLDLGDGESNPTYTTNAAYAYRTDNVNSIEDYVVVQYLRGCKFESQFDGATVTKTINMIEPYFGNQSYPFQFKDWMIDTDSDSPVYSSYVTDDGKGPDGKYRYAILRWNKNPDSLDSDTATFYFKAKPKYPKVFLTDMPGGFELETNSSAAVQIAKNSSVEFRTCIFRSKDVPDHTDPHGQNVPLERAISCFQWDSKFVYNFATKKYESPAGIDPVCATDGGTLQETLR